MWVTSVTVTLSEWPNGVIPSAMDISPATDPDAQLPSVVESVSGGPAGLSELQREFARHFVLNGGNSTKAAILAGYSDKSAHVSAHRNLVNVKVLAEIKRLSVSNVQAFLPIAIRTLVEIACDPEADPRARVQAANSLLDRAGMAAPKGGVQVNVGVQVNGQQVQALIGEVWDARSRRMSGIGGGMSDNSGTLEGQAPDALAAPTGDPSEAAGGGGMRFQGPIAGSSSIPPPEHEHSGETAGGIDAEGDAGGAGEAGAAADWRLATRGSRPDG